MKAIVTGAYFLLTLLALSACHNKAELDSNGVPGKLIVAIYAGGDNPGAVKSAMAQFGGYLEKKLNMPVEFVFSTDYTSVIEAIQAKKAHIAYLSPFSYVLGSQKHDITPIVTLGENGKPAMYHSVIFTNPGTGINSISDLKAKAKTLTLCFADPASTSGHLIPRAYLTTIGLNPDSAFRQVIFAGSHAASVLSVASRKIDIGCSTTEYGLQKLERSGALKADEVKILWQSDPIVSSPIVVRNDLNKDFVKKVQGIYLNLAKDAPGVFAAYIKLTHPKLDGLSYMTVQDSLYNGLRKIARGLKDLNVGQ
jgi:phosphonate transport system substrate-binding protein